jgi:hypothetical protein
VSAKRTILVSLCALALLAAVPAQASLVRVGPYGVGGGLSAFELNTTSLTWDNARVAAYNRAFLGVPGHLAAIGSAAENALLHQYGGDRWIGLTDATAVSSLDSFDPLTSLGTGEFGNTSGLAYPPAGQTPGNTAGTQRGEGWAWLTGEPLVYQSWGGGEPNNSGNEDAAHMRGDGMWNDHHAGSTIGDTDHSLTSLVEYELGLADPLGLPVLNYRERKANTGVFGQITNLAKAEALLDLPGNSPGLASERIGLADRINLLGAGGDGRFGNNDAFLLGGDDFVSEARGYVHIPAAGQWTFGTNTDDGSGLWVGPFAKIDDVLAGPHDHLATFNFATSGWYPIRIVFFERGGGDEVELYAAQGSYSSWSAGTFALVGDVANGGLEVKPLPEPTTLALLGLGAALAACRRRRRAA